MPYTNTAKNSMLDHLVGQIAEVSIHTSDPGSSGSNEASGGTYARILVSSAQFSSAGAQTAGEIQLNEDLTFNGGANEGATHFGIWDDSDNFLGSGEITGDTQFNTEGEFTLLTGTSLDLNN